MHTTNYHNTFIETAEDCPVTVAETPPERANPTVAAIQYEMIAAEPYRHTSDDVIFHAHATRKGIAEEDLAAERKRFFSKGQPCLRTSPLARRYGWGIHHDAEGRVALVPAGSDEYRKLETDPGVTHTRAMRSKRV
jgi:hypothetical protein